MTKQNDSAPDVAELKLHGVGRDEASERTLVFYFNRVPTDHELKAIHERNNAPDADALEFVKNAICLADFDFDREKIGDEQWAETIALAALTAVRLAGERAGMERAAGIAEKHRYGDGFLDNCGMRREHRADIATAIRAQAGEA